MEAELNAPAGMDDDKPVDMSSLLSIEPKAEERSSHIPVLERLWIYQVTEQNGEAVLVVGVVHGGGVPAPIPPPIAEVYAGQEVVQLILEE